MYGIFGIGTEYVNHKQSVYGLISHDLLFLRISLRQCGTATIAGTWWRTANQSSSPPRTSSSQPKKNQSQNQNLVRIVFLRRSSRRYRIYNLWKNHCNHLINRSEVYSIYFYSTFVHLYVCTFVHLFICTFVHLYICTFVHLYICTFVHLYICALVSCKVKSFSIHWKQINIHVAWAIR